jgi:hypothetical protein
MNRKARGGGLSNGRKGYGGKGHKSSSGGHRGSLILGYMIEMNLRIRTVDL